MGQREQADVFKTRDLDLVTFLRFRGFKPLSTPTEDSSGTRWVAFEDTPQLKEAVLNFLSGNAEARLLQELRRTRSFVLDSEPIRERTCNDERCSDSGHTP